MNWASGQLFNMLRLNLLCVVASLAVLSTAAGFRTVPSKLRTEPEQPYSQNLRDVDLAVDLLLEQIVLERPVLQDVKDPRFQFLLIVGFVERAGRRAWDEKTISSIPLAKYLTEEVPKVFRNTNKTQERLLEALVNTTRGLEPLVALKRSSCEDLDDKDCDKVLQWKIDHELIPDIALMQARAVLKEASFVAKLYLRLQNDFVQDANSLNSFQYLATSLWDLARLVRAHAEVVDALNRLY